MGSSVYESCDTNASIIITVLNYFLGSLIVIAGICASIYFIRIFGFGRETHSKDVKNVSKFMTRATTVVIITLTLSIILTFVVLFLVQICPDHHVFGDDEHNHDDEGEHDHDSHDHDTDHDEEEEDEHSHDWTEFDPATQLETVGYTSFFLYTVSLMTLLFIFTKRVISVFAGSVYSISLLTKIILILLAFIQILLLIIFSILMMTNHDLIFHSEVPIYFIWTFGGLYSLNLCYVSFVFLSKLRQIAATCYAINDIAHIDSISPQSEPQLSPKTITTTSDNETDNDTDHDNDNEMKIIDSSNLVNISSGSSHHSINNATTNINTKTVEMSHTGSGLNGTRTSTSTGLPTVTRSKSRSKTNRSDSTDDSIFLSLIVKYSVLISIAAFSSIISACNWIIVYYLSKNERYDKGDGKVTLPYYIVLWCLLYQMFDALVNLICLSLQFNVNSDLYNKLCSPMDKWFRRRCKRAS